MKASLVRRSFVSIGVGLFIYGRFSASGNYSLLWQCYEIAASQGVAEGCSNIPDAIDGDLRLMLVGFMLVSVAGYAPRWISKVGGWIRRKKSRKAH